MVSVKTSVVIEAAGPGLWRVRPFPMQPQFLRGFSLCDGGYDRAIGYAAGLAVHLQCDLLDVTGRLSEGQARELVRAVRMERKFDRLSEADFLARFEDSSEN